MWQKNVKLVGGLLNVAGVWWRKTGAARLKAFAPYSWMPVLAVASLSLLVSYRNYQLQVNVRPVLEFTNGSIDPKSRTLTGYWQNRGRINAWYGKARLFAVDERGKRADQPFTDIDITGAGGKVFAGMGGQMRYQFPSDQVPSQILVCVTYSDDDQKSYQQRFLIATSKGSDQILALVEQMPPIEQKCY